MKGTSSFSPLDVMMNSFRSHFVIVLTVLAVIPDASAATRTIRASKDNSIFEDNSANSAGGSAGIFTGMTAIGSPRRGLLAFDVAGEIPAGATISSAELTLYLGMAAGGTQTVGLHRLTKDWGEGTAGSSLNTVRNAGAGFPASPGDATWTANILGTSLWSNPGAAGDFTAAASATIIVGDVPDVAVTWLSTAALVADVQAWLDNPSANFGWALINNEASAATARAFYSREATVDAGGDPMDLARRPALTISFVPEPSSAVMALVLGVTMLVGARRRQGIAQYHKRRV
jgi:hypothetical protein